MITSCEWVAHIDRPPFWHCRCLLVCLVFPTCQSGLHLNYNESPRLPTNGTEHCGSRHDLEKGWRLKFWYENGHEHGMFIQVGMRYPMKRHENEMMIAKPGVQMDVHPQKKDNYSCWPMSVVHWHLRIFKCHVKFQAKQWQKTTIALWCPIATCIFEVLPCWRP